MECQALHVFSFKNKKISLYLLSAAVVIGPLNGLCK